MLMVGTAAMIMLGGTGFAFYTFRTSLTAALGDPDKASAFLGPDAAASLDRLILGEMLDTGHDTGRDIVWDTGR